MTNGVRIRLIAFAVLAAVGVVYVSSAYLGLVDKVLGRGLSVYATLPNSGGLFVGSEVTYRGVKVGKVGAMEVRNSGLRARLDLEDGTLVPRDSAIFVHNLSAVGEQYLDIEPADAEPPYLKAGETLRGSQASLPVDEADLLVDLDEFVNSVDKESLRTVVRETGTMFRGTSRPLSRLVDSADGLLRTAMEHEEATYRLLDNGQMVLRTQKRNARNIRGFARGLALLSGTLERRDPELRKILEGGSSSAREVKKLMSGLEPTLPVFLGDLVTLNQIVAVRLPAVEQLLVTFPVLVSSGFVGTPGDGYGHVGLQFDQSPACTEGYMPPSQWRRPNDLEDSEIYPAKCLSGPPMNMRGTKYAPSFPGSPARVAPYDPATGRVLDKRSGRNRTPDVGVGRAGELTSLFGTESWQWMLVGPVSGAFPEEGR